MKAMQLTTYDKNNITLDLVQVENLKLMPDKCYLKLPQLVLIH